MNAPGKYIDTPDPVVRSSNVFVRRNETYRTAYRREVAIQTLAFILFLVVGIAGAGFFWIGAQRERERLLDRRQQELEKAESQLGERQHQLDDREKEWKRRQAEWEAQEINRERQLEEREDQLDKTKGGLDQRRKPPEDVRVPR